MLMVAFGSAAGDCALARLEVPAMAMASAVMTPAARRVRCLRVDMWIPSGRWTACDGTWVRAWGAPEPQARPRPGLTRADRRGRHDPTSTTAGWASCAADQG